MSLDAADVAAVFDRCFAHGERTVLRGGGEEPLYTPAAGERPAVITFSADYQASALHEVAHWCIAGRRRRALTDFGYWYRPDGRGAADQEAFVAVEARPQAVEWCFHVAAGSRFRISLDNLDGEPGDERAFARRVFAQACDLRARGLPARAARFVEALALAAQRTREWRAFEPAAEELGIDAPTVGR